jgi:hypothetical protein
MGVLILKVLDELFKLSLCPLRGKVGKLRLEGAHQICGGISDFTTKLKDPLGFPLQVCGQAFRVRVKTNAQHAALRSPCRLELLVKGI